jgi:hypothetical protein
MDTVTIPEAPELLILHPGLPMDALVEKLTLASRWTDVGHRTLAFYLADMQERGLHATAGYPSALHFALDRLQMSESQARALVAAGRELREMTEIDGAFCWRRLSWSKVKLLLRVVDAETAVSVREQWLDVALKRSCRELESLVKRSEKGKPPASATHLH